MAGEYLATAYCNKFGPRSINGTGVTAGGTDLTDGKDHYVVAAGVGSGLKMGDTLFVDPDPYGAGTLWVVDDHGGAIVGRHIDLYIADCQKAQAWGRKRVKVTINPSKLTPNLKTDDAHTTSIDPTAPVVAVANAIGDVASIAEKVVESLFSSSTWFRVGKVVVGLFLGLFGIIIIARPLTNALPPSVKTAAKVAAI